MHLLFSARIRCLILVVVACFLVPGPLLARQDAVPPAAPASPPQPAVLGKVTTQSGSIPLGGALVMLSNGPAEVGRVFSDGDGSFRFDDVTPGRYSVMVTIMGFDPFTVPAVVTAGTTANVLIDLQLAKVAESVDVVASDPGFSDNGTLASTDTVGGREIDEISSGGGLQSALRLLVSVIEVPGGLAIKGGRPSQASVQIGPGIFVDPATGLTQGSLPDDAIEAVTVLPNPYAVEYGRFSSGVVLIRTRRAADKWKTRINDLEPAFRTQRHEPLHIVGIQTFSPRFETGGPLIKDKLFLQTSAEYRYHANDVPSRPQDQLVTSHRFSTFTRADANMSPRHSLTSVVGVFPNVQKEATLGTFTPPEATVDIHGHVATGGVTERAVWSDAFFSETTFEASDYHNKILPQGNKPMLMFPEQTLGNFFNHQERTTSSFQFIETLSGSRNTDHGLHLFKVGLDLLRNRFDATSTSLPAIVYRPDGTVARRVDFSAAGPQGISSTDVALFLQDRWQPNSRWYLEGGGRLDRDGVIERVNFTPRVGAAFLLNESGSAVLRSGYGLFFERTPSAAGVFTQYENQIETRYAADGTTPLGPPQTFAQEMSPSLRTPRSATWDIAYDHRFNPLWAIHAAIIDRRGSRELVVERQTGPSPALVLDSFGRSQYREFEVGAHFTKGSRADLNVSYVESRANADLNAFTQFFDAIRAPVFGPNAWAPARTDAPHRLLARSRVLPTERWLLIGVFDWRSGLPYSAFNESLDYVGPRNGLRFPAYFRVDLTAEYRFKFGKYRPWIGVRAENAFDAWLPSDVQANTSSPAYGTFYNGEYRQFRIQVRFER